MKVIVNFFGPLADYTGQELVIFELPQGATYGDLLNAIGERFGDNFHRRLWDNQESAFKAGIIVTCKGTDLEARNTPLTENDEIRVVPVLGGG